MADSNHIEQLNEQISLLPVGYISKKTIRGKECFYRQWKESGKIKSQYIPSTDVDYVISLINKRKDLQAELLFETNRISSRDNYSGLLSSYAKLFYMGRRVPIGVQSYEALITNKSFYIDKTSFISEWWESSDEVTLITRPRRFGKTLNMSMLNCFFSIKYANRNDLFEGLDIWRTPYYRNVQGTYPVISMSFGSVKMNTVDGILQQLAFQIHQILAEYQYLQIDGLLTANESNKYDFYYNCTDFNDVLHIIPFLCQILYRIYGKKVIILLDEYDTPMLEAWTSGIWDDCAVYLRNLFNSVFKSNPYLERALMTGITQISKESFFSDINHICVASITSQIYSDCFGFTEEEVFDAMDSQHLSDKNSVKEWYNGYTFGNRTDIYNPWSIINYLSNHNLKPYWVHSASDKLLNDIFKPSDTNLKYSLEDLMNGSHIFTTINEEISFKELNIHSEAVWSLLFASGYLKAIAIDSNGIYELAPTNKEVFILLDNMVKHWFSDNCDYNNFLQALLSDDVEYMTDYLNMITNDVFSYYDTSGNHPERFFHGFFLGLVMDLKDKFIIKSNRESGLGRFDVTLEPLNPDKHHAIIIEFKVHRSGIEGSLVNTARNALSQINDKNYAAELISHGISSNNIYNYGIAFKGKEVHIETDH